MVEHYTTSRGVLYICADDDYLVEARKSALRVKQVMPDIPVGIITNSKSPGEVFNDIVPLENPEYGFADKVYNYHRTPYERTLYLDVDTYVTRPVYDIFEVLDRVSFAAAHAPTREKPPLENVPSAFPEVNAGILAYEMNPRVERLFSLFREEYDSGTGVAHDGHDQAALRVALYNSNVDYHILPPEYNCRIVYPGFAQLPVSIIHGNCQESNEELTRKLNGTDEKRVFYTVAGDVRVYSEKNIPLWSEIMVSLLNDGLFTTIRRGIQVVRN